MTWIVSAFADEAGPSIQEQIAGLKKAGFKHIDIRSVDKTNISAMPLDMARQVKAALDAAGIKVNMFGSPLGKIDLADDHAIDMNKLRHMGQLADVLGCRAVRIFSYYNRKAQKPVAEFHAQALNRLRELRKLAGDLGMVLYHENEADILGEKLVDVQKITAELRDGKTFKMIFDFGNFNHAREDVWKCWEALRGATDAFHLKENRDGLHVPIGTGPCKVKEILGDALKRGWSGPLVLEPHLKFSAAVMATGPTGQVNQSFKDMTDAQSFGIASDAANKLFAELKAPVA
jgi:sugar phosphate isomerase/epimerase